MTVGKTRPVLGRTIRTPGRVRVVRCVHSRVDANLGIEVRREARSPSIQHEGTRNAGADTIRGGALSGPAKKRRPRGRRGGKGGEARLKRQRLRAFRSRRRGILFVPESGVSRGGRESPRGSGLRRRGGVRRGGNQSSSHNRPDASPGVPLVGNNWFFPRVEINCVTCSRSHVIEARLETVRASRFGLFADAVLCPSIFIQWREDPPRIKLVVDNSTYEIDMTTGELVPDRMARYRSGSGQRPSR